VSREVPEDLGELSNYAFDEAMATVEQALAGAPPEVRRALSVIKLVSDVPRRSPWYGIPIDPEDSSVTVGVMMRNAVESVGDWIDGPLGDGPHTKADSWFTRRYLPLWRDGKLAYYDYLDHLSDPLRYEAELARRRMQAAEYAAAMQRITESMRNLPPGVTRRPRGHLRGY
jgi:hypothetical protein